MPEPGIAVKLINDQLSGHSARVWVDGVEISKHLSGIEIKVIVGESNEVHLVGFARSIEAELQASIVTTAPPVLP